MKIVVLAGGNGTRLFPLSREYYPKQFLKVGFPESLFQKTVKRCLSIVENERDIILVGSEKHKFMVLNQLKEILGKSKDFESRLLLEPVPRNTAPAIAFAVKFLVEKMEVSTDEILMISPSDHLISPEDRFIEYAECAEELAKQGYIVTFGVRPVEPKTGYGYIEFSNEMPIKDVPCRAYKVKCFHEKPDIETAQRYLESGKFLWNSGIFVFSIKTILEEFEEHCPEICEMMISKNFDEFSEKFHELPDISIDYAVMEKTNKAVTIPLDLTWSDMGSWDAYYEVLSKDSNGNAVIGNVINVDSKGSLVISTKRPIATVGIEDLLVVDSGDFLLIAKKGMGEKVREIVKKLKNSNLRYLTKFHNTVYRPWGSYTELERGKGYKVKRLTVEPGKALSLQLHYHRSEHWVVVRGTAKVLLEKEEGKLEEVLINENESIYVPKRRKHKLINPGKVPLEVIEVQVGEYLEEDDIVRFDVDY